MTKVKSKTRANPQNISLSVESIIAATIVVVKMRLCQNDLMNSAMVYQIAIVTSTKNGRYSPGTTMSRSSAGSTVKII